MYPSAPSFFLNHGTGMEWMRTLFRDRMREESKLEKERGGKEAVTTCIRASTPTSKHDLPSVPRSRRLTPRTTQPRNSRPVPDFDGYHLAAAPVDATRNDQSREIGRITGKKGRNEARPLCVLSLQGDRIK